MIIYALARSLQYCFSFIFFLPAGLAVYLMRLAGNLAYQVARTSPVRAMTARNIRAFFPNAEAEKLADKLLRNIGLSIFEVLCTPFFGSSHLKLVCEVKGLKNIDLAQAKRKGVLVLAMHVGNYELTPTILRERGYRVSSILKASRDLLLRLVNRSRAYKGIQLINVAEADMYREALRALAADRCVYLLIDTGALESRHELINFSRQTITGRYRLADAGPALRRRRHPLSLQKRRR